MELRETQRAVTPFGGLVVFLEFLRHVGYREAVSKYLLFRLTSPNAIDPAETFTAFLLTVVAGARRFAHTSLLRADVALHAVLGISRFPVDDTIRNLFKRFGQGQCQRLFSGLWSWQLERLPGCLTGYSLDLDSTVFERYGRQQGALRGPNPRKHERPSHHPLVAVLAEVHFLLHGWLRSGNCGTARGVVEFLKEAVALLPEKHALRVVRADAGFFDQQLLGFLEQRGLSYIIVARLTLWLKREAARVSAWRALDEHYAAGELSATPGLGPPKPLRGDPRAAACRAPLAGKKVTRCSRLHLPRLRQQSRAPTGRAPSATITTGRTWKIASPN